jgi:hypothetical protein
MIDVTQEKNNADYVDCSIMPSGFDSRRRGEISG